MQKYKIIESSLESSYWNAIARYFELVESHILAIRELLGNAPFQNLYAPVEFLETLTHCF